MTETVRTVVGRDEPPQGRTRSDEKALPWAHLARIAYSHGVCFEADELAALRHDVDVSAAIRVRLTR